LKLHFHIARHMSSAIPADCCGGIASLAELALLLDVRKRLLERLPRALGVRVRLCDDGVG